MSRTNKAQIAYAFVMENRMSKVQRKQFLFVFTKREIAALHTVKRIISEMSA